MTTRTPRQKTNELSQTGSICSSCARKNGGVWPKGHVATHWYDACSFCGEERCCCCTTDWSFPGVKADREF